jgi:YidC/Oxa1 family membrane protein insertase
MFRAILINPLFNLLILIYAFIPGNDFGLAIIVFTILVRLALWPLVNKQLHSQKAMQALAPDIAKVREKAKGDKQLEGRMLMDLYKEKQISPFASLVPVLIQLPLFIALFIVLQDVVKPGEIAKLTYGPLREIDLIKQIIADGAIFKPSLLGLVDLTKPNVLLALLAGATQYYQTKQLMPNKKPAPGQPNMNFMTYLFPVLTAGIALSLPAALALYWIATSALAILQQSMVLKQDVAEMEEQPKVVVTQKSTAQATKKKKKK